VGDLTTQWAAVNQDRRYVALDLREQCGRERLGVVAALAGPREHATVRVAMIDVAVAPLNEKISAVLAELGIGLNHLSALRKSAVIS
jgi:hypothetical protein